MPHLLLGRLASHLALDVVVGQFLDLGLGFLVQVLKGLAGVDGPHIDLGLRDQQLVPPALLRLLHVHLHDERRRTMESCNARLLGMLESHTLDAHTFKESIRK